MIISDSLLDRVERRAPDIAITTEQRSLDYCRLTARVEGVAASDALASVSRGELVALRLADPIELLVATLAVDRVHGTPLICDSRWSAAHTSELLRNLGPTRLLDAADVLAANGLGPDTRTSTRQTDPEPGDLAWAGFSSGSTGAPRAIVRTRASWLDSFEPFARVTGMTAADSVLLPVPLSSSLSMFAALHTLWLGARVLVPAEPSERAVNALLAEATVVHATPPALQSMIEAIEGGAAHALRLAIVGGAALPDGLREQASALGIRVIAYYGAAELSFLAIDVDGQGLRPFPGVDVRLEPLPPGDTGQIWVRSPYCSEGYLGGASGPFERAADGWATVGDLATVPRGEEDSSGESGVLRLRGRRDGAILTAAATVVPEDVETVVRVLPGVTEAVVFGAPHEHLGSLVCVVVETDAAAGRRERLAWQSACRERLTTAQQPRLWFATASLPRTSTGKPARAALIEAALTGTGKVRRLD